MNTISKRHTDESVHHTLFPKYDEEAIDTDLEQRMDIAQKISSLVLGLRRKVNIKVRQPLQKMIIPVPDENFKKQVEHVRDLILTEVNVKKIEYLDDNSGVLVKRIKPDFKVLGPKYGKLMKQIATKLSELSQEDINYFEQNESFEIDIEGEKITLTINDVDISFEDIPGWLVAHDEKITVALDVQITDDLKYEGIARELVNRIQNIRKDNGYDVTDKIHIHIQKQDQINETVKQFANYIKSQTLALDIILSDKLEQNKSKHVEIDNNIQTYIQISRN